MHNKAKWKAFMKNDNISILAQFDGHVSIHAHGMYVSVFSFTL